MPRRASEKPGDGAGAGSAEPGKTRGTTWTAVSALADADMFRPRDNPGYTRNKPVDWFI